MMASNVFSSRMPSRSFYEELRGGRGGDSDGGDDRAGLLDEENLNHDFHDRDLERAEELGVHDGHSVLGEQAHPTGRGRGRPNSRPHRAPRGGGWPPHHDEVDNDVPASLLIEHRGGGQPGPSGVQQHREPPHGNPAMPGPPHARTHWETAQAQQRLHSDDMLGPARRGNAAPGSFLTGAISGNARKRAEWRWANVSNLDRFINEVYAYYLGRGIWCILLERALHLINIAFVAFLLTFLTQCVDYGKIRGSQKLSEILVPQCTRNMSGLWNLGLWLFAFYFIWKSVQFLLDIKRLLNVRDFYLYMLEIPDDDMQTVTWQEVVARVMTLRDQNIKTAGNLTRHQRQFLGSQSKERLDASDIANRLMRRENYMIALINKDILDLTIPLPFAQNYQLLSRALEFILIFSILDFVFDDHGQVNQLFLKADRRGELSMKLRTRFLFSGVMILVMSPFIVGYLVIVYFLTYFYEAQKNPAVLSARSYTPLAEWKFREFNELPHLFRKRLDMSHPFASHYIDQFPKARVEMVAKTVSFVAGSLATVLAVASIIDSDLFLGFEITPERNVLFYTAVFGGIWAFARGSVSEENTVFDPEYALRNVIEYTHYQPDHWQDRLHSYDIKMEFSMLYKMRIIIFLEELLSILTVPFVCFSSLPKSSDQIIDFFREFTIHIDGLGYVCSFAEFDFKKAVGTSKPAGGEGGGGGGGGGGDVRDDYYATKHGKMEASYYGFLGNYGNFALNPKTTGPSHLPPNMRHTFHPPPAWPTMNSPTLAADMQASRGGRTEPGRTRGAPRNPQFRGPGHHLSPMASILLDPHHQPPTTPRNRQPRAGHGVDSSNIIEEGLEEGGLETSDARARRHEAEDISESGGELDASAWQTSPTKNLTRENSGVEVGEAGRDVGVVQLMKQFHQAQFSRPLGGL
ncbi:autophagy protein Apg9-domain-containing protein [Podospora conica]|nr:autophagy protein Apg9-domain-containing protein [Schizothecium conicum]